ncbi:MAG: tetratricopeptide repeat protein [Candidatus Eisenbacteria bacterium]
MADPPDSEHRIALLYALVEADPTDATAHFLLGRELLTAGRAADAASAFTGAIGANPDYAAAYRQLGNALELAGRRDEAADAYRAGVTVAGRTNDLQAGKEMAAFLKRLARGSA